MDKTSKPVEKAHPAIARLLKPHKLTPMEYRAKWLKAGVLVLRHIEKHLLHYYSIGCLPESERIAVASSVNECRAQRSRLAAELEGWKY